MKLGRNGRVTMVQAAITPAHVLCFDIKVMGPKAMMALKPLLEDPQITKLCYDARCDADALTHIYQARSAPIV